MLEMLAKALESRHGEARADEADAGAAHHGREDLLEVAGRDEGDEELGHGGRQACSQELAVGIHATAARLDLGHHHLTRDGQEGEGRADHGDQARSEGVASHQLPAKDLHQGQKARADQRGGDHVPRVSTCSRTSPAPGPKTHRFECKKFMNAN